MSERETPRFRRADSGLIGCGNFLLDELESEKRRESLDATCGADKSRFSGHSAPFGARRKERKEELKERAA